MSSDLSKYNLTESEIEAGLKKARTQIYSSHTAIVNSMFIVAGIKSIREAKGDVYTLPDKYNSQLNELEKRLYELDDLFRGIKDEKPKPTKRSTAKRPAKPRTNS